MRGEPGSMQDTRWLDGLALLEKHGLSWDLRVPFWHLEEAAEVAALFPRIAIVLEHAGLPWDRSDAGLSVWRRGMQALARNDNVHVKLSEFGLRDAPWRFEDNAPIVRETVEIFGWQRCMFGSNFPVASLRIGFKRAGAGDQRRAGAPAAGRAPRDLARQRAALLQDRDVKSEPIDLDDARRSYLASGDEALLPIVDAHHHYWDLARNPHPWLQQEPRIAFRYGDYGAICRDYLPADHRAAAAGHCVVRNVMMEGEWDRRDPLGEARWAHALAGILGVPHAMAAQIWLDRGDLDEVLRQYRALPLVRSVRHKPRVTTRHEYRSGWDVPGSMRCPRWRNGYAKLEPAGLMFELQAPWWHLAEAVELARDFPRTTLIVNHAGLPAERDEASLRLWRRAVERLADCPNVVVKISGLGVASVPWTPQMQKPVVDALLASFGIARCMFASNHPVDALVASFDTIYSGFKQLTRHLSPTDRLALFCDNAARLYQLR